MCVWLVSEAEKEMGHSGQGHGNGILIGDYHESKGMVAGAGGWGAGGD